VYKSWAAIEDTTLGYGPAQRTVYPDSAQRKRIDDAYAWIFEGAPHVDNIYQKAD
jgi:hypothetical protein